MNKTNILMMGTFPPGDMELLETEYTLRHYWNTQDKTQLLAEFGPQIRAVGTRGDLTVPRDVMDALPKLEIIGCFGVGVDGIDLAEAKRRNITVTNTPGVLHEEVADMALGLMLAIAHQIPQSDRFVRAGQWAKQAYPLVARMYGKRLGLIGMGAIGTAIAKRCEAFGMDISYNARHRHTDKAYVFVESAEKLAAQSDFLTTPQAQICDERKYVGVARCCALRFFGSHSLSLPSFGEASFRNAMSVKYYHPKWGLEAGPC